MPVSYRYHLSAGGVMYALVTLLIGFGAINSQNNLLFIAFGLAIGGLLVSGVVSGAMLMNLRAQREAIAPAAVGGAMAVRYVLTNRSRLLPAFALLIREEPERARRGRRADKSWERLMPPPSAFIAHLGARRSAQAEALASPFRRGETVFSRFSVSSLFPFGVIRKSVVFEQRTRALVRPEAAPVEPGLLRRLVSDAREHEPDGSLLQRAGRSGEPIGLRAYVAGDSLRRVAWRASARTGDLVVREIASSAPQRLWIVLQLEPSGMPAFASDAARRAGSPVRDAQERAISLAAGLIDAGLTAGLGVGLIVPGLGARRPPSGAPAHSSTACGRLAGAMLDDLARIDLEAPRPSGAPVTPGRGSVVVIHAGPPARSHDISGAIHLVAADRGASVDDAAPEVRQ